MTVSTSLYSAYDVIPAIPATPGLFRTSQSDQILNPLPGFPLDCGTNVYNKEAEELIISIKTTGLYSNPCRVVVIRKNIMSVQLGYKLPVKEVSDDEKISSILGKGCEREGRRDVTAVKNVLCSEENSPVNSLQRHKVQPISFVSLN